MQQTIQDFENWLAGRRLSPRTIQEYVWQVRRLAAWGAAQHPPIKGLEYKPRDLSRYLAERRLMDEVGDSSIRSAISSFNSFFIWTLGKRKNPAKNLEYPQSELVEQRTLTPAQAARVLEVPDTSSMIGRRDLAILCLLLDTGLRASEVCNLSLSGVRVEENYLTVPGKGRKFLFKAFCDYTAMQLANWLAVRQAEPGCDRFFVSVLRGRGSKAPAGTVITREAMRGVCARVAGPAGIPELSPHDFRRTCTCFAVALGCPDRLTKMQLGWGESPNDMLTRYSLALRVKQFIPYSPVAWLMSGGTKAGASTTGGLHAGDGQPWAPSELNH